MKSKLLPILLGLAALFSVAQTTPTVTESLVRIQADTITGEVSAFFEKAVTFDGTTYRQPWQGISWINTTKPITVNGETKTYGQVMAFVVAIAAQERADQAAAAAAAAEAAALAAQQNNPSS